MFPKPVQQPHPPIHIGGETPAALRRAARLGQGWHTFNRSPDELAAGLAELDDAPRGGRAQPRRPAHHGLPLLQPADARVRSSGYAEAGADAVAALFFAFTPEDVARAFDDLEACREAAARA